MNQFGLLNTRRFFPIFSTQFLGAFNDNIYKNSLVIFIAFPYFPPSSWGHLTIIFIKIHWLFLSPLRWLIKLTGIVAYW